MPAFLLVKETRKGWVISYLSRPCRRRHFLKSYRHFLKSYRQNQKK